MNKRINFDQSVDLSENKAESTPRKRIRLHDFPMWENMSDEEMDRLLKIVTLKSYRRGDTLFTPEDNPDRLYLLQLGRVKTYVLTQQGQKKIIHIFSPGDAFGGLLLGADEGRLPWAEALEDVIICSMDEFAFKNFMMSCPNMCLDLFRYTSQLHVEAMRRIKNLLHTRADQRVVYALLDIGRRLGCQDAAEFTIYPYFTHEDLSEMVGVIRSTVSEVIAKLREEGIVNNQGRKLFVNRHRAEAFLNNS